MRKLVVGLLGAAALSMATAANADITVAGGSDTTVSYTLDQTAGGIEFAIGYHDAGLANPFEEMLTFENTLAGSYDFSLTTTTVDISELFLSGTGIGDTPIPLTFTSGSLEQYALLGLNLGAGTYTLHINGSYTGRVSSFGGDINFAAVPEPATWAMMLLGFGAVGFAMRRRRQPALLQLA